MNQPSEMLPSYIHIDRNEFLHRKHRKLKEEDIAVCVCVLDANDSESACGDRCLNVLTSTECTPAYCPCGVYCRNQKFQRCCYASFSLFKTEGRGWGLLAGENIKAGQFVIEYCGEVISSKEAKTRSQAYEAEGLKDAYIITLSADESIDATRKGSLARFINHSCKTFPTGTELSYDYNFEWFGGAKVRCLCGAPSCCGFLGAKSRGFQEANYLWEDDDARYAVENIPLYDSEDDELAANALMPMERTKEISIAESQGNNLTTSNNVDDRSVFLQALPISVEPLSTVPMELDEVKKRTAGDLSTYSQGSNKKCKGTIVSGIKSNSACRSYQIEASSFSKRTNHNGGKLKRSSKKQVDVKFIEERLASKEAGKELLAYEEAKNRAASQLETLYDEIRPAIEEHEKDNQDSVPTTVAEKWIEASCAKIKAEFDLYSAIVKTIASVPRQRPDDVDSKEDNIQDGIKLLENGV